MGIINEQLRRTLGKIREVRNNFAHSPYDISFDSEKIIKLCRSMRATLLKEDPTLPSTPVAELPAKFMFRVTCASVTSYLADMARETINEKSTEATRPEIIAT
jgi:hypothetical protein